MAGAIDDSRDLRATRRTATWRAPQRCGKTRPPPRKQSPNRHANGLGFCVTAEAITRSFHAEYRGRWALRPVLGGGSRAIEDSHRMFNCARCHRLVVICRHCDRGQRYCSAGCAQVQRRHSVREAGRRYQRTPLGTRNNAARQKRWRWRIVTTVTHQGSTALAPVGQGPPGQNAQKEVRDATSNRTRGISHRTPLSIPAGQPGPRCDFCGRVCGAYTRRGTLGAQRRRIWPLFLRP